MKLIGLLLNLAVLTATARANHDDSPLLTLQPADRTVVRYTNESLIVECRSATSEAKLQWKTPRGEVIKDHKGRIHIEQSAPENLKIVFAHISLADKGNWSCELEEEEEGGGSDGTGKTSKSFDLIVYQKITFTENSTILTVKEGNNATILCEVKGEPQPNVTWNFNGQPINIETANSTKFRVLGDGLLINKVTQNDTGEYTCRAYQVNPIASDMQERTVLMKIEHKPFWTYKHHLSLQYAYLNGTATITCEAIAEPPANFSWYRSKKRLHNDKHFTITAEPYMSELSIVVRDPSVFDTYRCKAQNSQGAIERTTSLERGEKPPPPAVLQLRGFNSNTFDVDVGSVRSSPVRTLMEVNGYRIEYMTDYEFRSDAGKWTNAKRKDFPFEDGATFLINNLEPNTTYYMRAASRNLAGLSDWTKVEKFRTLSNEPPSSAASGFRLWTLTHSLMFALIALFLGQEAALGCQPKANRLVMVTLDRR